MQPRRDATRHGPSAASNYRTGAPTHSRRRTDIQLDIAFDRVLGGSHRNPIRRGSRTPKLSGGKFSLSPERGKFHHPRVFPCRVEFYGFLGIAPTVHENCSPGGYDQNRRALSIVPELFTRITSSIFQVSHFRPFSRDEK